MKRGRCLILNFSRKTCFLRGGGRLLFLYLTNGCISFRWPGEINSIYGHETAKDFVLEGTLHSAFEARIISLYLAPSLSALLSKSLTGDTAEIYNTAWLMFEGWCSQSQHSSWKMVHLSTQEHTWCRPGNFPFRDAQHIDPHSCGQKACFLLILSLPSIWE